MVKVYVEDIVDKLEKIRTIMNNPLLILDNEQMQLLNITSGHISTITVLRATNNSELSSHSQGALLKVIPFKDLSISDLDKILPKCKEDIQYV